MKLDVNASNGKNVSFDLHLQVTIEDPVRLNSGFSDFASTFASCYSSEVSNY